MCTKTKVCWNQHPTNDCSWTYRPFRVLTTQKCSTLENREYTLIVSLANCFRRNSYCLVNTMSSLFISSKLRFLDDMTHVTKWRLAFLAEGENVYIRHRELMTCGTLQLHLFILLISLDFCFILYVWVFCLQVCICMMCMPSTHRGQMGVLDHL